MTGRLEDLSATSSPLDILKFVWLLRDVIFLAALLSRVAGLVLREGEELIELDLPGAALLCELMDCCDERFGFELDIERVEFLLSIPGEDLGVPDFIELP